jgi:hypothetical protein
MSCAKSEICYSQISVAQTPFETLTSQDEISAAESRGRTEAAKGGHSGRRPLGPAVRLAAT